MKSTLKLREKVFMSAWIPLTFLAHVGKHSQGGKKEMGRGNEDERKKVRR